MSRIFFIFLFAFCFFWTTEAQELKKIKQFKTEKVKAVSVDRLGNFFLVFENRTIKKYDAQGKVLASLKSETEVPTLIESWLYPKIFLYLKNGQQLISYDHNFENPEKQSLDASLAIDPILVCPTNDHKLLVLDKADYSIKKIDAAANQVIAEFYIDSTQFINPNFIFLREYQDLIFVQEQHVGIAVYDKIGKRVNQCKGSINNFGFFGEEIFFLQNNKIIFQDLYTDETREIKVGEGKFVIVTDERIFMVRKNDTVDVYEFSARHFPESFR